MATRSNAISLKLLKVGDALVLTIPDSVLDRYNLGEGDRLDLDSGPEGFTLKPVPVGSIRESAGRIMERHRGVLKRLAE